MQTFRLVPLLALAAVLTTTAVAQPVRPAPRPLAQATPPASAAPPGAPATNAPVPTDPQRTTSTFGDWTLRCERPENAPQTCEVGQSLFSQGQAVAQTAVGRLSRTDSLRMTVLVPVNATLTTPVKMTGTDVPALELAWRRCVPAGCLADTALSEDVVRRLRTRTEPARLMFQDAALREAGLPFSSRGLAQALDALAKEDTR